MGANELDGTVSVIDPSPSSDGLVDRVVATIPVGSQPDAIVAAGDGVWVALGATLHTLYVLANAGGDHEGQLDAFDTRTCSARGTDGCTPAAGFDVGRAPFVAALDPVTQHLFVADFEHAAISVIDTGRCNATRTTGCRDRQFDIGDAPAQVSIDPATHSAFALAALYNNSYYPDTRLRSSSRS